MINKNIPVACIVVVLVILIEFFNNSKPKHPHAGLTIEQLVGNYGYPIEKHEVVTDDGYILTTHRIPHGPENIHTKRTPVLFMHGFIQSAADFINLGPNKALSFLLVDKGYDVWLGNARGTTWSRKHKVLDPRKDKKFWEYSLDEIGYYDVPAFIDYILKVTGVDSLHYVGYSQGTTVFFILGSEKPEYMKNIKLMTALAPAMFLQDPTGPVGVLIRFRNILDWFLDIFNFLHVLSADSLISTYLSYEQINKTELSVIYTNTPAGASPRQIKHIAQLIESGVFSRCDLGKEENIRKYGQKRPPPYDVTKVSAPVALYYASNDWVINVKNVEKISRTLPNVVKSYKVPLEAFNHNDFIYAKNVVDLLYAEVLDEILKY